MCVVCVPPPIPPPPPPDLLQENVPSLLGRGEEFSLVRPYPHTM